MSTELINGERVAWDDPTEAAFDSSRNTLKVRERAARMECQRRIFEVFDSNAQMNLLGAKTDGLLDATAQSIFSLGLLWIKNMRETWPTIALSGKDPYDNKNWPELPGGVRELADQF